eukprot:7163796-Pyramimonas_sp.AAC.1
MEPVGITGSQRRPGTLHCKIQEILHACSGNVFFQSMELGRSPGRALGRVKYKRFCAHVQQMLFFAVDGPGSQRGPGTL